MSRWAALASHGRTLRELVKPVSDEDLPHLSKRLILGVRTQSVATMVGSPLCGAIAWASGMNTFRAAAVASLAHVAAFGFIYWLAGSVHGRARPQLALFMLMMLLVLGETFAGVWLVGMSGVALYTIAIPVVASAFFPWRPSRSLLLGATATLFPLLVVAQDIPVPMPLHVLFGAAFTAMAAAANQIHRRLWLELEQTRNSLVAFDRLSTLGRMVAGIAHELKTPTAAAGNSLAHIKQLASELDESIGHPDVTDDDRREILRELTDSVLLGNRAVERSGRFLQAIRAQTLGMNQTDRVEFDVARQVGNSIALLGYRARQAGLRLEAPDGDSVTVYGDPAKLEQVVTNLVSNGIDACGEAGQGSVVRVEITRDRDGVLVAVHDDGPGIPAALATRVFEPMFTTRATTGGTGLGLSIARDIVEGAFGGTLRLVEVVRGTRIEIRIPDGAARSAISPAFVPSAG